MDINEMTDADLAAYDAHLTEKFWDHLPENQPAPATVDPYFTHVFGGIDGRCFGCDVRPSSRHANEICPDFSRRG